MSGEREATDPASSARVLALLVFAFVLLSGCGAPVMPDGTASGSPVLAATSPPRDPATATTTASTPTTRPSVSPGPAPAYAACAAEPDPPMCDRAVDDVLSIASFGELAPSDVLFESECEETGCTAQVTLLAPNGFGIIAELERTRANEPWAIVSVVRDPGGPVPLPSASPT
jgi:hypothetical protein